MDKITPYKSIKKEAKGRKFARFKQVDRERAGEDPEEGAQGRLEEEGRRGEKADAVKGTCQRVKIMGEDRSEWKRGREKRERAMDRLIELRKYRGRNTQTIQCIFTGYLL